MTRFLMLSIASVGLFFSGLGCSNAPEKAQMKEAIDELRMMRQEMARMGSPDTPEYEIRVALMAFYSYLLKKDADVPYHIPTVEVIGDVERIKRYSYWAPDTYIRDVHYNGDRFDYIEIKDLKITAYDTDARASYKIVPYERVTAKVKGETRSMLRPILINNKPLELFPPKSPVRLKKLATEEEEAGKPAGKEKQEAKRSAAEEAEEPMWKVNYRDALIARSVAPEEEKPGFLGRLLGQRSEDIVIEEDQKKK